MLLDSYYKNIIALFIIFIFLCFVIYALELRHNVISEDYMSVTITNNEYYLVDKETGKCFNNVQMTTPWTDPMTGKTYTNTLTSDYCTQNVEAPYVLDKTKIRLLGTNNCVVYDTNWSTGDMMVQNNENNNSCDTNDGVEFMIQKNNSVQLTDNVCFTSSISNKIVSTDCENQNNTIYLINNISYNIYYINQNGELIPLYADNDKYVKYGAPKPSIFELDLYKIGVQWYTISIMINGKKYYWKSDNNNNIVLNNTFKNNTEDTSFAWTFTLSQSDNKSILITSVNKNLNISPQTEGTLLGLSSNPTYFVLKFAEN